MKFPGISIILPDPRIYIYCHPQTDCFVVSQLISVTRHTGRCKLGLKPTEIYIRLIIIPPSHQSTYVSSGIKKASCSSFRFANGPGDLGSIPGRVIPKTLKMELDTTLLNTQHYKVRFKGKVEQSWEWSSALPYTLV